MEIKDIMYSMDYSNTSVLESNRQIKINFDAGLLLIKEFVSKLGIDTVRLKLLKIAAKVIHSARYITFKLCSSCPYKDEFYETLANISKLQVQLE